jgi:hypothetical protein
MHSKNADYIAVFATYHESELLSVSSISQFDCLTVNNFTINTMLFMAARQIAGFHVQLFRLCDPQFSCKTRASYILL